MADYQLLIGTNILIYRNRCTNLQSAVSDTNVMEKSIRDDLVYPELSYKIVGILYDVYNDLGYGYQEKYYEKAVTKALEQEKLEYKEQLHVPFEFKNQKIGDYYLDFLVEDKIVIELKKGDKFSRKNIEQVYAYLKAKNLKLGILAQFSTNGLKFKRIVNLK